MSYPNTPKIEVRDTLHGVEIIDNYRWLEKSDDPHVIEWVKAQEAITRKVLDTLPQRDFLIKRFGELWRYDDEGVPNKVIDGERIFYWVKKKDDEKYSYYTKAKEGAPGEVCIDPNKWDKLETLAGFYPSRDGKYVAFGKARAGDENPVIRVMEVATGKILPDTLRGWKQYGAQWLPNNEGFYYSAKPLKGAVPEGEENYWHTAYYHKLGTPADMDFEVFSHDSVKEYFHSIVITEDGKYLIYYRGMHDKNEAFFKRVGSDGAPIPIAAGFDASYNIDIFEHKIFIMTDKDAPMFKVYVTDVDKPEREYWKDFLPEKPNDKLSSFTGVAGHFYAHYEHNAYFQVKIYSIDGKYLRDLPFPTIGSGDVSGYWSRPEIWVYFSSFTYPSTIFKYDFNADSLILYRAYPVKVDVQNYEAEQVWYNSKDGTRVSMFLIHRKDIAKTGANPTLLTGYGGFNIPMSPYFNTSFVAWLEAGGMVAVPNLRGGGEYGRNWHEAGMRDKKQNVFDDFIAAAEWLISNKYTDPQKLAISGGSNGGLLMGAVTVQRPDLFRVVMCSVPLLDMVRYHKFGLANIWAEEYGSADSADQFKYIYKYSPYHNVVDGAKYPAMLIIAGENDARVDPLHARKMAARMQEANPNGEPIFLLAMKDSGHGGGTTLSVQIAQAADEWSFLMAYLGMKAPLIGK